MSHTENQTDPYEYVRENKETLVRIIKHGDDKFVRSLALAVLLEFGDDPDVDEIRSELDHIAEMKKAVAEP